MASGRFVAVGYKLQRACVTLSRQILGRLADSSGHDEDYSQTLSERQTIAVPDYDFGGPGALRKMRTLSLNFEIPKNRFSP